MPKQQIYQDKELPEPFKWQVLDFLRIVWSDGFEGKNSTRDWITKSSHHPLHFVLIESNNLLVSYVGVVWKYLEHAGEAYKMYGWSGVFTYPQFRGQHYGLNLVKKAKQYIEKSEADICLFPSKLTGFYEKAGFPRLKNVILIEKLGDEPVSNKENVYMLFLSEKGKTHRQDFETKPIYFGETVW